MAEEAKLTVTLVDKVTSGLNSIKNSFKGMSDVFFGFKAVAAAFGETFGRVIDFLKTSLAAYSEQETAINRLNIALKNQGFYTEAYSNSLVRLASELQSVTTFSDETILETTRLLTTFGLAGKELEKTTKAALDLSVGMRIDLHTATFLLGKAFAGQTQTLSRYGLKVDESRNASEKFAQVLEQIGIRFGGSAQAEAGTYAGKVKQLANAFNDLQEKVGALVVGPASKLVDWARTFIGLTEKLIPLIKDLATGGKSGFQNILEATQGITTKVIGWAAKIGLVKEEHAKLLEILGKMKAASAETEAPKSKPARDLEEEKAIGKARLEMQFENLKRARELESSEGEERLIALDEYYVREQELIRAAKSKGFISQTESEKLHAQNVNKFQDDSVKYSMDLFEQRKRVVSNSLNFISSLTRAKSKELQVIGKAAAVSSALIDTYSAASSALKTIRAIAWLGPAAVPIAMAAAAAITTAGLANVAAISGVPVAHGGVVLPRSGGVPLIAGEAGKAEAVIPLDSPEAQERMGAIGIGGGTIININAGVVVADRMSVDSFAREIDKALYNLKRNRESVAFG